MEFIKIRSFGGWDFDVLFNADRCRLFLRSWLWLWLPAVLAVAFSAHFLLAFYGEELPLTRALTKSGGYSLVVAFGWALGVWASSKSDNDAEEPGEKIVPSGIPGFWWRIPRVPKAIVLSVIALVLICQPQIVGMAEGNESLAHGFGGILLKMLTAAAVVLPIWLYERNK